MTFPITNFDTEVSVGTEIAVDIMALATLVGCPPLSGERRLAFAILTAALRELHSGAPLIRAAAQAYITKRDASWPFSFDVLCEYFGLAGDRIRAELWTQGLLGPRLRLVKPSQMRQDV